MDSTDLAHHPFEIEVHDLSKGLDVISSMLAEDLADGALSVDQPHHVVLVIWHVPKPLAKHLCVDFQHGVERWKELG